MASNPMVIPEAERYGNLKNLIFGYVDQVAELRAQNAELARQFPQFFLFLTFPWVADQALLDNVQTAFFRRRKDEIEALGFNGEATKKQLEEVLATDKHLAQCCPTLLHLVNFLDLSFITGIADAKQQGAAKERVEFAYDEFESLTYHQGRFKRIALSHLFNFEMEGNSVTFKGRIAAGDVRIERLDASTIPSLLGESGFQAFLHPRGIGDCFVVEEEAASADDDLQWLLDRRQKALTFAQALQYFQDGVVHIGYSVPFFQPNWVNQIRRSGLFFLGEPRRLSYANGAKPYKIDATAIERLSTWWRAITTPEVARYLENKTGKLRQAIYRAGEYYETSHQRADSVERLLALAIAVESLFSPSDKGELRFRISQSAAQFIGKTAVERGEIFKSITKMYDRRSSLVHGSYDVEKYDQGKFVSSDEIDQWATIVRRAVLGFVALYLKGDLRAERDPILNRISEANFDDGKGDLLRKDADIERILEEFANN
jgi:hypothetical protein